ncbi:LemA family protein [Veillonella sp. R32]|uniref:LemA family protein n=1 Tax=Veillonella sp. R32 TaxID=2021312 RepID=UPI001EE4D582|nr:LemA family protein [Veillonella sp. R32]
MSFLLTVILIVLIVFFIKKYNRLQNLNQEIKEARSNIKVVVERKVAIVNQFTELVNSYGEYEKLMQLQVSGNYVEMAKASSEAVTSIQALANTYPELKANTNYNTFLQNIAQNESILTEKREAYNSVVKGYNSEIAQIPMVFVASVLGFKEAPYFDPNNETEFNSFSGANTEAIKELAIKGTEKLKDKTEQIKGKF